MRSRFPQIPPPEGEASHLLEVPEDFFFMNHIGEQPDTGAHHHQPLEIAVILSGTGTHRTTFGDSPCRPGHVYLIFPSTWHAYTDGNQLELYNCLLSQPLLDGPLAWALEDPALGALLNPDPWLGRSQVLTWELPEAALPEVRELLEELSQIFAENPTPRGKLVARLLLLLDFIAREAKPNEAPSTVRVHSSVRRAVHALRQDLARPWTLPDLAAELRINPSYLIRLFQQATGQSPIKFLARERAQKAAQLLLTTADSIAEIGTKVGWDEPKQFARSFRQQFGESASEFRRRLQGR